MNMDRLAPGTRFFPTEDELLEFYLPNKLLRNSARSSDIDLIIPLVDLYNHDAPQLPAMSGAANRHDPEQWFFFCPRQEREAQGGRPTRTTPSGYWKATGSPSYVYSRSGGRIIGQKRTLVFYRGRAPSGRKTIWKMNEYKAVDDQTEAPPGHPPQLRNELSLCRVYIKTGTLPRSFDRRPPPAVDGGAGGATRRRAHVVPSSSSNAIVLPDTTASSNFGRIWSPGDDGSLQQLHGAAAGGVDAIDLDAFQDNDWDLWAETDAEDVN